MTVFKNYKNFQPDSNSQVVALYKDNYYFCNYAKYHFILPDMPDEWDEFGKLSILAKDDEDNIQWCYFNDFAKFIFTQPKQ